jgi:hypothetical protein
MSRLMGDGIEHTLIPGWSVSRVKRATNLDVLSAQEPLHAAHVGKLKTPTVIKLLLGTCSGLVLPQGK